MTLTNPFLKSLQKVWKKKDDFVISYMKAANKVKPDADLEFLINIRIIVKSL